MSRGIIVGLAAALAAGGCTESDVGQACPELEVPHQGEASTEGDVKRTEGSEVVEYNTAFPCEDIVCVATLGRGAYCTRECSTDANCPTAFTCRELINTGDFAGRKFCAWKECEQDDECGDPWEMACTEVPELGLTEHVKLCQRR